MFVDQITITAQAGHGGTGVIRWSHEKFRPMAGPSGGNGGRGGDVYLRAVPDVNRLAKYTGAKTFTAESGLSGGGQSLHGRGGVDIMIDVPVGSRVTDLDRQRHFEMLTAGETVKVLKGGSGGLGNKHFKSSTNRSPEESTPGTKGEFGRFLIEVALVVDVGLVGLPNAGKSTLLNLLTAATSRVGAYPFTTTEPHLGALYEFIIADVPGLIEGAASGKGLGHTFLRHVSRTKMILHLVSLATESPIEDYYTILAELESYDTTLIEKEQWIVLTKKDLVTQDVIDQIGQKLAKNENRVFVISENDPQSIKNVHDALVLHLRTSYNDTHQSV